MNIKLEPLPSKGGYKISVRVKHHGKTRRKSEEFHGGKREANKRGENIRDELLATLNAGKNSSLKHLIFSDCVTFYREKVGEKTFKDGYAKQLNKELGHLPLDKVQNGLFKLIERLCRTVTRNGKPYSPATINRYITYTQSVFKCCIQWELLEKTPLEKVPPKQKETPRDEILSEEQQERLLQAAQKHAPHLYAIIQFALLIPCRKSELVNMRVEDVNLFTNTVRIRNGTTKNGKGVTKPIPPQLQSYFRSIPDDCKYVFYREQSGRYLSLGNFTKSWNKCRKAAGIPSYRWHDTRHTAVTRLVMLGLPERVIMECAGWRSVSMLSTYYNRSSDRTAKTVFDALSQDREQFNADKKCEILKAATV